MQLLYFVNNLLLLFNDTGPSGTFCNIPSEFAISINISIIVPICPLREQREREIFGGFMGLYQGHGEFGKVVNPSDTRGFKAQKKTVG